MGKAKSVEKSVELLSASISKPKRFRSPGKKYTEKEIINVLQYILDHYDEWTDRRINNRTIIVRALDHYNMKDRTPYAMHFKISGLQFEYKKYGKTTGFSNMVNDMVAKILKRNVEMNCQQEKYEV